MKEVSVPVVIILLAVLLSVLARNIGNDAETTGITTLPTIMSTHFTDTVTEVTNSQTILDEAPFDPETKCECAVFTTQAPSKINTPIVLQSPTSVNCDVEGESKCLKACIALAAAAEGGEAQLFCSSLGHYYQLKTSVHSRTCDAKKWTYTGITSPDVICCHQYQVIDCKKLVEEQPNN